MPPIAGRVELEVAPEFPDGDAGVDCAAGRELDVGVPFSGARQRLFDPSEDLFQHVGPHDIHGQGQSIPEGARRQHELRDIGGTQKLVIRNQRSVIWKRSGRKPKTHRSSRKFIGMGLSGIRQNRKDGAPCEEEEYSGGGVSLG